jgi:hypothetical protein
MFFFFQVAGGEESWQEALAETREEIVAKKKRNPAGGLHAEAVKDRHRAASADLS